MSISTSFKSAVRAALQTEEAIALQVELLELSEGLGLNLVWLCEETAKALLHGVAFFATLLVWGLVELWGWLKVEAPRFVADVRSAIVEAVANAQAEPIALPWSAEIPVSNLEAWSNSIEIQWPEPSATAKQWVTGMMPR